MYRTLAVAFLVLAASVACSGDDSSEATGTTQRSGDVAAPQIPEDFTWTGRYQVPDLDIEVPFTWHGNGGDFQMIAGGDDEEIHFTNLLHDGTLYTLTYEWPGVPRNPCSNVGPFTLEELNEGFADAHFVGAETLHDLEDRSVHHFRSTAVLDLPPEVIPPVEGVPQLRIPLMAGDLYVDAEDPNTFWKILHFGLQNLYDPDLDEWIVIDEVESEPGQVDLPDECAEAPSPGETDEN